MFVFSSILGIDLVEDRVMMKDRFLDRKPPYVDSKVNQLKWLKMLIVGLMMLMVDSMINLFRL